jgi:hypothetical protein
MTRPNNIFLLWEPMTDYNETQIYGKLNADINWAIFREAAEGKTKYKPLQLKLRNNKVLKKDLVSCPGCNGLISKKGLEIIGMDAFRDFIFFPLTINEVPYFALYTQKNNDCLDEENSLHKKLNIGDTEFDFWEVEKYNFHLDKIKPNTVFTIPQTDRNLYCTEEIGRKILENELVIMAQPLLLEEKDVRKRVQFNNPVFGVSFDEPLNWQITCEQYDKLKKGKKLKPSDWQTDFGRSKTEIQIVELQRFELLQSNNWLDKARIYIQVSMRQPEVIFNERSAITKIDIPHPDLRFDCRVNEYNWERTLIAPYKKGLSFVVIIVTRDDDEKYLQNAINVFQTIKFNFCAINTETKGE